MESYKVEIFSRGDILDVTNIVLDKMYFLDEMEKGGVFTFSILKDELAHFFEGDKVVFTVSGKVFFTGYIFTKKRDENQIIEITCYDNLIYLLKNRDTYIYQNETVTNMLLRICTDYNLETGVVENSEYKIDQMAEDGQTLFNILQKGIVLTKTFTKNQFILKSVNNKICLLNGNKMGTNLFFSHNTNILSYKYETSIDNDVANYIKVVKSRGYNKGLSHFNSFDSENMKKWGRLTFYEKVDRNLTDGVAYNISKKLLSEKNKLKRRLSIKTLGNTNVFAGSIIFVEIKNIGDINVGKSFMVLRADHYFEDGIHTMDLVLS